MMFEVSKSCHKIVNKAFIQKSKTIKFKILSRCASTALPALGFSDLQHSTSDTHRYTHTNRIPYAFGACAPRHN